MKIASFVVLLGLLFSVPGICQTPQLHSELCGAPNLAPGAVALPPGMSVMLDRDNFIIKFSFKSGDVLINTKEYLDEIAEVCPLSGGRIVAFGADRGGLPGATSIYIIDSVIPALLDSFGGYQPLISPDQRWIVFRKSYSPHNSQPVSEEYLLYDLSSGSAQNRGAGITANDTTNVGMAIFPLGQKNQPFDNDTDLPDDQLHATASDLYWAPDSKAIAFADRVLGKTSLVLVILDNSGSKGAFLHSLEAALTCGVGGKSVKHIDFIADGGDRSILVDFAADCGQRALALSGNDFQPAKIEAHTLIAPMRKSIKGPVPQ